MDKLMKLAKNDM